MQWNLFKVYVIHYKKVSNLQQLVLYFSCLSALESVSLRANFDSFHKKLSVLRSVGSILFIETVI